MKLNKSTLLASAILGSVAFLITSTTQAATMPIDVPVGNSSFNTVGTQTGGWYALPTGGDWSFTQTNAFQILQTPDASHFTSGAADNVLNMGTVGLLTQTLDYTVNAGDIITLTFELGNSANQSNPPGGVNASFTIGGTAFGTTLVANTAGDNAFVSKSVEYTATTSGALGIRFQQAATGAWIDDVSVSVVPEPSSFALLAGMFAITGVMLRRRGARMG